MEMNKKKIGFSLTVLLVIMISILMMTSCDFIEENNVAFSSNKQGLSYLNSGEAEKAIKEFEKAIENGLEKSVGYTNLCWAYYDLGELEKALDYIEMAEELDPFESSFYVIHGHILLGLLRYDEAINMYQKAIQNDVINDGDTYYAIGSAHMAIADYEKAAKYFQTYLDLEPYDVDAKIELANCYIYQGELLKAYTYIEQVIADHSDMFAPYDLKGYIMESLEKKQNVEAFYKEVTEKFPDEKEAWLNIGIYYHGMELYHEAIAAFEEVHKKFPDEAEIYTWLSVCFSRVDEIDKAKHYAQTAIDMEPNADNYNAMGNILFGQTKYLEAITYYEKATSVSTEIDVTYYSNIVYAYLLAKRYQKAIDYGLSAFKKLPYSYEIPLMMAYAYQEKNDYNKAIEYLTIAKERKADAYQVDYGLAENYYYLGNYDKAEHYIEACLENNLDDQDAIALKKNMTLQQSGSENIVKTIVNDYYLYKNNTTKSDIDVTKFRDLSHEDTKSLFDSLVQKDDPYSFYIYGDQYDYLINDQSSSIDFKYLNNDTILVNIRFFNGDTDHLFIEFIDAMKDTENKTLILNVMDNGGGVTESAVNMLDSLLPSVSVCSLIDRMGYSYPYYTSESMIKFKEIYVFINKNSASASELLTLGLDTFLDNVTIVGEKSHGKGVGQLVIEQPDKKSAYFIVNHYWNVREINIMDVGIEPDIVVEEPAIDTNLQSIGFK